MLSWNIILYYTSIAQLLYLLPCQKELKLYAKTMLGDQPRGLLPRLAPLSMAKKGTRKDGLR